MIPRFLAAASLALSLAAPLSAADSAAPASTFLHTYAASPVKWQPWSDATFARAKSENKPIFLLIGTATSELARAQLRQTFSNADAAAFLNDSFICIAVDAKERPALTALYQNYLAAVKQLKGFPMNLFLTPELKPFDGANYLPPTEEWGKEGFLTVAKRAAAGWKADAAAQRTKADDAVTATAAAQSLPTPAPLAAKDLEPLLKEAADAWIARADTTNGGFGDAAKYPEPELLRFLLQRPDTRDLALTTLRAIATGAIHDPLDGGFFRYTSDPAWRQPYLQKNLVDQARLALAFLDAAPVAPPADQPTFNNSARSALIYLLDRLTSSDGELATAEDATPDDLAPHYYWSYAELKDVLGADTAAFATAYGATAAGNLAPDAIAGLNTTGKNVLYRATPLGDAAAEKKLATAAANLLHHRDQSAKPLRDEVATSGAHGLVVLALARAGAELKDPRFAAAAKSQFAFIRERLLTPAGTLRRLADGATAASAQDYALVARALVAYAKTAGDDSAAKLATSLIAKADATLFDPAAGRYLASTLNPAAGLWAKTFSVEPAAGEAPAAEPVMLATLRALGSASPAAEKLAATLAADVKSAAETARGDQLLALVR